MMAPYPFFGFPMARRPYPYYSVPNPVPTSMKSTRNHYFPNGSAHHEKKFSNASSVTIPSPNHSPVSNTKQNKETEAEECFEIFGIKLYFDDLLLVALLFFLYQEEVKDTYLYIALVLLLLS